MTRGEMLTALQATGFGNTTADLVSQKQWLDAAYLWVWNARDPQGVPITWSFEKVDQTTLAVVAGTAAVTMPSDFGTVDRIVDNYGSRLDELDPDTFDTWFAPDVAANATGLPAAYKVVNRQVVFGPTPSASATFRWSYRRRVSHYNASSAITAGTLSADTDTPLWPDHHLILVHAAALIGHSGFSNPFSELFQSLRDEALSVMRTDLEAEFAPSQVWGDGGWG